MHAKAASMIPVGGKLGCATCVVRCLPAGSRAVRLAGASDGSGPVAHGAAPASTAIMRHGLQVACHVQERLSTSAPSEQAPALPRSFRRWIANRVGSGFREVAQLVDKPLPVLGSDEVLVKILYAGVNGGCETFRTRGELMFAGNREKDEYLLGAEAAGVVAAVGDDVSNVSVGQPVVANGVNGFSEYGCTTSRLVHPVPAANPDAVVLALSGFFSYLCLKVVGEVRPGQVVLVTAAAGAAGHLAVQIAGQLGAKVVGTCGSSEKAAGLQELGCLDRIINYNSEDVGEVLAAEYPGGVDVIMEGVGGQMRETLLKHLAPKGRLIVTGFISEYAHTGMPPLQPETGVPTSAEILGKQLVVDLDDGKRITGKIWSQEKPVLEACRQEVWDLMEQGKLTVWVDRVFEGLETVPDAIDYMLQGGAVGKVVLKL